MFVTDQVWDEDYIGDFRRQFRNGKLSGAYGYHEVKAISRHIDEKVSNHVSQQRMFYNFIVTIYFLEEKLY